MKQALLRLILIAMTALAGLLASRPEVLAADETPGMTVWGQVYVNRKPAPVGTEVKVSYGQTLCATAFVTEGESSIVGSPISIYTVDLPARPSGPCGGPGQTLTLNVDGFEGGGAVNWGAGARLRQNVFVGNSEFYAPIDLISATISAGDSLAGEGKVSIRAEGRECATANAVPIGNGVLAIEDVPIWTNSVSGTEACARVGSLLDFFLDGRKLDVLLGWGSLGAPNNNGEHFVMLGTNPGGALIHGGIFINEEPAAAGTRVQAVVGDVVCGESVLEEVDPSLYNYTGSGTFLTPVGGIASGSPACVVGAKVRFRINDDWVNETIELDGRSVIPARLTVGESDFLPIGGEVIPADASGLPMSGTLTVMKDGVECGSAPVIENEFGKHLFTDLIARCGTQDVHNLQFFFDHRPLSVTYTGEFVAGIVAPASIQYVNVNDTSEAMYVMGNAFVNGQPALPGTRIDALVGDTICGQTSVRANEDDPFAEKGRYWLEIDSAQRRDSCGVEGAHLTFRVDGLSSNETISWQGEDSLEGLHLTVGGPIVTGHFPVNAPNTGSGARASGGLTLGFAALALMAGGLALLLVPAAFSQRRSRRR